jgi:hypothetical protein
VDLGKHTPVKSKNVLGDHALVFMFQPFMGKWTQPFGCFLSKNNANGDVLAKLCMEAIVLMENAGFYVDGIVADGATWNRKMWDEFGIDLNKGSSIHPTDVQSRRLFFFSDFPHLIKNARSFVLSAKEFQVKANLKTQWKSLYLYFFTDSGRSCETVTLESTTKRSRGT